MAHYQMSHGGYVSNQYHSHGAQPRCTGCSRAPANIYTQPGSCSVKPSCGCQGMTGPPPVVIQPHRNGNGMHNGNGMPPPDMMGPDGIRDWTTGLCGCFEHMTSCCLACCCPCCFACHIANKMDENPCGPCCLCLFCTALRTKHRLANDIEGSVCKDMCTMCCCVKCALAQLYRDMKNTGM